MERGTTSLASWKCKFKHHELLLTHQLDQLKSKIVSTSSTGKDGENLDLAQTAGGNAKWCGQL